MCVSALQGVKGPGHFVDANIVNAWIVDSSVASAAILDSGIMDTQGQRPLALCQCQFVAKVGITIQLATREHVGLDNQTPLPDAQKPASKAGSFHAVEGAHPNASRLY